MVKLGGTGKGARARKAGDQAHNARRRYYRAAERYMKQAENSVGAQAAKLRGLAELRLRDALNTYDKRTSQRFAKPIQRIASALGIDLDAERQTIKERSDKVAENIRERYTDEQRSKEATTETKDPEILRQREAQALFNSDVGSRIIGGTVELWQDEASYVAPDGSMKIDNAKILPILYDKFGVDNLADLIDKMEGIAGEKLYEAPGREEFYESAKITIQTYIANGGALQE